MRSPNIFESLSLLKEHDVPIGAVLDIGIQHSTPVLMRLFPELHHHLFEPVQEYYSKIETNYAEIDHTLVEVAVSDVEGVLNLHTQKKTRVMRSPTAFSLKGQMTQLEVFAQSRWIAIATH